MLTCAHVIDLNKNILLKVVHSIVQKIKHCHVHYKFSTFSFLNMCP